MPWIAQMKMLNNQATAYVCRGFACDAPSTDPAVLAGSQVVGPSGRQAAGQPGGQE